MHPTTTSSVLRYSIVGFLVAFFFGLSGQEPSPAAASGGDVRVLYLFDASAPEQITRFSQLQRRARAAASVQLVGLSRQAPAPEGLRVMPAERFLRMTRFDAGSRRWVAERLKETGDALRVERGEAVFVSNERTTIEATAALAGVALITTDINFSTWGKVKDLFR